MARSFELGEDAGAGMVASDHAGIDEKQDASGLSLHVDARVVIKSNFKSHAKQEVAFRVGSRGLVKEVDDDGDALVDFEDHDMLQWVAREDFGHVEVFDSGFVSPSTWYAYWWRLPLAPFWFLVRLGQLEDVLAGPFATRAERDEVVEAVPSAPQTLVHYFAWRRATIAAAFVMGVVHFLLQVRVLWTTIVQRRYFYEMGNQAGLADYEDWIAHGHEASFVAYSLKKIWVLMGLTLVEVLDGSVKVEVASLVFEFAPLVLLGLAIKWWTVHVWSRRYVLVAWAIAFFGPIIMSSVPMRFVVCFESLHPEVAGYVDELAWSLHLEDAQRVMLRGCDQIIEPKFQAKVVKMEDKLRSTCNTLTGFPIEFSVPCGGASVCHVNMKPALDACKEAILQFELGKVAEATKTASKMCHHLSRSFGLKGEVGQEEFGALLDIVKAPFQFVMHKVAAFAITINVFRVVFMIMQPVLMIGPGMVRAGVAAKVLLPHAGLPGALILFVSCIWSFSLLTVYAVVFQYVESPYILFLLLMFLAEPTAIAMIGAWNQVTQPTSSLKLAKVLRKMDIATKVILFALVVDAILIVIYTQDLQAAIAKNVAWLQVAWGTLACSAIVGMAYFYLLTTFAVLDYLVCDVTAQQRYWRYWHRKGQEDKLGSKEEVARRMCSRNDSYDALAEDDEEEDSAGDAYFYERPDAKKDRDLRELFRHRIDCELQEEVGEFG